MLSLTNLSIYACRYSPYVDRQSKPVRIRGPRKSQPLRQGNPRPSFQTTALLHTAELQLTMPATASRRIFLVPVRTRGNFGKESPVVFPCKVPASPKYYEYSAESDDQYSQPLTSLPSCNRTVGPPAPPPPLPPAQPPPPPPQSSSNAGLSAGAIAGIVIGAIGGVGECVGNTQCTSPWVWGWTVRREAGQGHARAQSLL